MFDERVLQRLAGARLRRAFNGDDLAALGMRHRDDAGIDGHAVDQHGASAAFAFAASFLGASEAAILAKHVEQALHRMRRDGPASTVDRDDHA